MFLVRFYALAEPKYLYRRVNFPKFYFYSYKKSKHILFKI
jgi:hypothetical protein